MKPFFFKRSSAITRQINQVFLGDPVTQSMYGHTLSSSSHSELVEKLFTQGFIETEALRSAMARVDRNDFALGFTSTPYKNSPVIITGSRSIHSVSTPQFHAQQLSLIEAGIGPGKTVLDFGTGTGYLAAVMAEMGCAKVIATEVNEQMWKLAQRNLNKYRNVRVVLTNGDSLYEYENSFDGIVVSPIIDSFDLIRKLLKHDGGIAVAPVRDGYGSSQIQRLETRLEGEDHIEKLFYAACEPLIEEENVESRDKAIDPEKWLQAWKEAFRLKQGRNPAREDIIRDQEAKRVFDVFCKSRKYAP